MIERDIRIARGDSFPLVFRLKSDGDPVNIAGASFLLTVTSLSAPPDATSKVFDVVGVIVDAAAGEFSFTPTTTDTATSGSYFFDIQMTDASSNVQTLIRGRFIIEQDRTK